MSVAACRSTDPERAVESSLVVDGRVLDASSSAPIDQALVHIQTLSGGKAGGEFGCTGAYLTGDWSFLTDASGRFTADLRLTTTRRPVCVVVLGTRPGAAGWRDTAWVVAPFKPVTTSSAPDTVRFALRM
jgi:hypothetical protein